MDKKKAVIGVSGLAAIGYGLYRLLGNDSEPQKYSSEWFKNATDEELYTERESVRKGYCQSGNDFSKANRLWHLLRDFDSEMNDRAWGDEEPHAPSIHREHGWYLRNDD